MCTCSGRGLQNSKITPSDRPTSTSRREVFAFDDLGIPIDNIEGMTFGPPLPDGRQTLLIVSDNNFSPEQFTQFVAFGRGHPAELRLWPVLALVAGDGAPPSAPMTAIRRLRERVCEFVLGRVRFGLRFLRRFVLPYRSGRHRSRRRYPS